MNAFRLRAAIGTELRFQVRYGILAIAAVLTALWVLVLAALPGAVAAEVAPFVVFIDTATFGAFLAAGLLLFERQEGVRAALVVSPLTQGEYLLARVAALGTVSVVSAVPIILAGSQNGLDGWRSGAGAVLPTLCGVALATAVFLLVAMAVAARAGDLARFLLAAPPPIVPLIAVPVGYLLGPLDHPVALLVPTTAAAHVIRAGIQPEAASGALAWSAAAAGYALVWIALLAWLAVRRLGGEFAGGNPAARPEAAAHDGQAALSRSRGAARSHRPVVHRTPWRVLLWIDSRAVGREFLLLVLVAAPVILAVVVRFGYPPLAAYLDRTYGIDITTAEPMILAVVITLHVPVVAGTVGALRLVEDADDRSLATMRVSPVSQARYLVYRMAGPAVAAAAGLAVALPLSGLDISGGNVWTYGITVLLAAAQAPLIMLAVASLASDKVAALAVMKLVNAVMFVPVAMWFLPGWTFAWLPAYWPVYAQWGSPQLPTAATAAVGLVLAALAAWFLLGTAQRRMERALP